MAENEPNFRNFVLGNQSADLDSVACCLALANFKSSKNVKFQALINIPRREFKLRSDICFVLRVAFSRDIFRELLFIDEVDLHKLAAENRLRLILVDHHELAPDQTDLLDSIVEVVDHHKPNEEILKYLRQRNVEISIETVGSCSTLIAERYLKFENLKFPPEFALLLYSAILIDTSKFTVALNKATEKDVQVGRFLERIVSQTWKGMDFEKFYREILEMREDVTGLSMQEILCKDYKYFTIENFMDVGFSTIRCNLEDLISKSESKNPLDDFLTFFRVKKIQALIILANLSKNQRFLAIFAQRMENFELICSIFEKDEIFKNLSLERYDLQGNLENFRTYVRGNIFWTRKQIMPFLKEALEKRKKAAGTQQTSNDLNNEMDSLKQEKLDEDLIQKFAAQIIEKSFHDLQDEAQSVTFSSSANSSSLEPSSATATTFLESSENETSNFSEGRGDEGSKLGVESQILGDRSFNMAADDSLLMTSFATPSTDKTNDSSTNKEEKFESFLEKTVTDLLDDYYQSPDKMQLENFYEKLEEKNKNVEEQAKISTSSNNNNNNHAPLAALPLVSYPPTPPNSFLNTPKMMTSEAAAQSSAFEPEKVDQKLRKISEASSMKPYIIEEQEFPKIDILKLESDTVVLDKLKSDTVDLKLKSDTVDLKLESDTVKDTVEKEAMSDADLETGKSTNRSQTMSVQLDWLDDDYIEKQKSDTENLAPSTSRTYGHLSLSDDDNLTQKSARTDNGTDKEAPVELEWENDTPVNKATVNSASDTIEQRSIKICGSTYTVDMALVEPYRKVISHGGYFTDGLTAIVVFSACHLPHRSTNPDYQNLMDNLFLYAVSCMEKVVAEDYVIVYFQGGASSDQLPSFSWLRKCYRLMDQRLVSYTEPGLDRNMRKNLKQLILVHSTFWLKTLVTLSKPFISSKFYKKVKFVNSLQELSSLVPLEQMEIPEMVLRHEDKKHDEADH